MKKLTDSDELKKEIKAFHDGTKLSNITPRHKSWEYCHEAFLKRKGKSLNDSDFDCLSLHLAVYLASWGMYRNIKLMNQDYKIHKEAIKECMCKKYNLLWDYEPKNVEDVKETVDLLFGDEGIIKTLRNRYKAYDLKSDTFITKILLGIFGCTPAFDRRFRCAYVHFKRDESGESTSVKFDENSFIEICDVVMENRKYLTFESENMRHPPMKCFDFIMWSLNL